MANHLYAASFRWVNMIRPSGFASSILTTESYLRTDVLNEAMVLNISTRFDISEEYVTKLTETIIIFLDNCEDMIERFKTVKVLANYFFGSSNIITKAYTSLTNWCSDNRSILEARFAMDTSLIPKLMVSTDERVHLFLKSCVKAEYPNRSSREHLNFQTILMAIELNNLNYFILLFRIFYSLEYSPSQICFSSEFFRCKIFRLCIYVIY